MSKSKLPTPAPHYSLGEEITNAITHGIGALLAIAGMVVLIVRSHGDPWKVVGSAIYGFGMIMLMLNSCMYHALAHPGAKRVFRVFDHTSIFLLIAGTYTPLTLVTMRGWIGWTLFGVVWASCIVGIVLNSISIERFKKFSMVCYLASGWCVIVAIVPLFRLMEKSAFLLLILGGLAYTVGVLFYRKKGVPYMHAIWHFFVLLGAVLHYFCIYISLT